MAICPWPTTHQTWRPTGILQLLWPQYGDAQKKYRQNQLSLLSEAETNNLGQRETVSLSAVEYSINPAIVSNWVS
jgi:hypothetical protein